MNDDFHDLFKRSVPTAPSTSGWVDGARRRRRRRRAVGGVTTLAVVALAVPLAVSVFSGGSQLVASPAPTPSSQAPTATSEATIQTEPEVSLSIRRDGQPGAEACYTRAGEPVGEEFNGGTIERGAARAWLCTQDYGTVGPLEPLVTDVDGLVEALYGRPSLTGVIAAESAQYYTVVFEYDDGRLASFTGDIQDDTVLTDGETELQGSEAFFAEEVEARWLAQRSALGKPAGQPNWAQACPVAFNQALFDVRLEEVVGGYACATEGGVPTKSVELRESLAALIAQEAAAQAEPAGASTIDGAGERTLVLRTAWGDELRLEQRGDGYEFRGEDTLLRWVPSPDFAAELDALLAD